MAKTADDLPSNVVFLNRRLLLGSLIGAAGVPSAAPAAAPIARPTVVGCAYLSAVSELRAAWAAHDDSDVYPGAPSASARRINGLTARLEAIERRIAERPTKELCDVIDRALVAARYSAAGDDTAEARGLIVAVLGVAGVDMAACIV